MSRLNTKQIEHAQAKRKEYQLSYGNCLYLRVRPRSRFKSWAYYFRLVTNRRLVRITLGLLQDMTLKHPSEMLPQLHQWVGVEDGSPQSNHGGESGRCSESDDTNVV
jgi:hypothetical protein